MSQDFDNAAKAYDSSFTNTKIGKRQRKEVWDYVDQCLSNGKRSILELNCGTGEDARHFAEAGHSVLATDISSEMLRVTQSKCRALTNVTTQSLDLTTLPNLNQTFDLIFSNFGGLNCLDRDQFKTFADWAVKHLNEDGSLILVIMPRDTLIEMWYRKYKRDKKSIDLRQGNQATAVNVDGQEVNTYFYNPDEVIELFPNLKATSVKATGYVPSYWSGNRLEWLVLLFSRILKMIGLTGKYGDHFLIHFRKSS